MDNPYKEIALSKKQELSASRQALHNAFLSLCKERAFGDISVKKLCEKAHVARTTFYANYMNTDDLLSEIEDALICDLLKVNEEMGKIRTPDEESRIYNKNMLEFIKSNRSELTVLLIERPDARLLIKWKMAVKYHFWEVLPAAERDNSDFVLEIIASMAVGAYTYLLQYPEEYDSARVYNLLQAALKELNY